MILYAQTKEGQTGFPWLVSLHDFSGDCRGWQAVGKVFQDYSQLYIDLPGHGGSADVSMSGFDDISVLLRNTLLSYSILKFWLVGYSLDGRVAMVTASQEVPGLYDLVVEGGYPDSQSEEVRVQHCLSDDRWATRFRAGPLHEMFNDWYQQPAFSLLNTAQREAPAALRSQDNEQTLTTMLEATSFAVQPGLHAQLTTHTFPFYYLCGERDDKFHALAVEILVPNHAIRNVGHNAHRNDPAGVVDCLAQILRR